MENLHATNEKIINESQSLNEIFSIVRSNACFSRSIKQYKVNKEWKISSRSFYIKIEDKDGPKIFVSCGEYKNESIESIKPIINNFTPIEREEELSISIEIENNVKELLKDDEHNLAENIASFIEFLFDKMPNARTLNISCQDYISVIIISKIKSCNIHEINGLDMFHILKYAKNCDLSESDFHRSISKLKTLFIYINEQENSLSIENYEKEFEAFLKIMSDNKSVTFSFHIDEDDLSKQIMERICDYAAKMNVKIKFSLNYGLDNKYFKSDDEFEDIITKTAPSTDFVFFFIDTVNCFKRLKVILNTFENLEAIKISSFNDIIQDEFTKYDTLEKFCEFLKDIFNYKGTIKTLKKLEISLDIHVYNEELKAKYGEYRDKFLEAMLNVFPDTVEILLFKRISEIGDIVFDKISTQFTNLKTISFLQTYAIPIDAFSKIQTLRNVAIHGELQVNIPKWIEIVMFLYYDIDYYYGCDNISENVKNEHYFELMNRSFNHSLRALSGEEIYYIAFLDNILLYKEVFMLTESCY
uniref:DUF4145 domain-containing protein n=1 Tax=Parastrongyloides trichosuri TaxID=131310 RepID=A0A0N5A753_PARTI